MTMPAAAPAGPPVNPAGWLVLTASERGASHVAVKTPNQDAVGVERAGAAGVVAAVADGHGHSRHLRSARGSRLAVSIGCRVGQELADQLDDAKTERAQQEAESVAATTASEITALLQEFLVPTVVSRWRESVLADVAADPFTEQEESQRQKGDDATIAYGSTLLLGITLGDWLILAQIGDGDVVGVRADGNAELPIPVDPQLDGLVTTSLCGLDATADFRVGVVDTSRTPLLAVLLASDGYGNAQVVDQWPTAFSKDLAWLLRERDVQWLAGQLPAWAARCASAHGSADDTTVALLISPAGLSAQASMPATGPGTTESWRQDTDPGSEETTIPAAIHSDTVPNAYIPPGLQPAEPVTVRQEVQTETVRVDAVGAETVRTGTVQADAAGDDPVRSETVRVETVRAESVRAESVRADATGAETVRMQWDPPEAAAGAGAR